jgi:dTDP-4-dehydrorhamnose reductase
MRVAVLGSSGLLGSFFEFAFDQWFGWEVTPISRIRTAENHRHIRFNELSEVPDIIRKGEFDVVVNCVAMASHEGCEIYSQVAFETNSAFPGYLAKSCEESTTRLIHISTDAVFDGPHEQPFSEEDTPQPVSVYGVTKLEGERRVAAGNPGALIVRTNFFSWSRSGSHGVLDFFYSALRQGESVNGFTDYLTSSLYVGDLAEMVRSLIRVQHFGVIHAVAGKALSKFEFGRSVAQVFGFDPSKIQPADLASQNFLAHRAPDLALSPAKLESILGFEAPSSPEGLGRAQEHMKEYWAFLGRSESR